MRQLKFAFRTLFKTPFVTSIAIISLAFGIGANSAIFSLFDQMLLRSLPVEAPQDLVNLSSPGPKPGSQSCGNAGGCEDVFSYAMFRDLEREQKVLTGLAAHVAFSANLAYEGQTMSTEGMLVSGSYFPVLGVRPALGRLLAPSDEPAVGEAHVAVLSHDYWQSRFGSTPGVLTQILIVNGQSMAIVGVAAKGFRGTTLGNSPRVFVPLTMRGFMQPGFKGFDNRRAYWAYLFGRLTPGTSIDEARAGLNVPYRAIINTVEAPLQKGMSEQTMARFKAKEIALTPGPQGQSDVHEEAGTPLLVLFVVTGIVLLIACANIANLLLARSSTRAAEMAVRLSIGASRRQLIGQLLTESCLLGLMGGAAGLLVARWTLGLIAAMLPTEAVEMISLRIDVPVMLFAAALSLGTGVLFGLFPALHSTRPDLANTLKGTAGQPGGARSAKWFRTGLATSQIALSMLLLALAGLFTKSLVNVSRVDLGLRIDNLVTFGVSPELNGYSPERSRQLFQQMEDRLAVVPGVTGVAASMVPLLSGSNWGSSVSVQGFQGGPDVDSQSNFNEVSPGFFKTVGIPILAGRDFTRADGLGAPKVAIVNETFAKKFGLGREAVGRLMAQGVGNAVKLDVEIVGLVQDAKYSEVKDEIPPLFFLPYQQDSQRGAMNFYVRSDIDAGAMLATLPKVMAELDRNLPLEEPNTMTQVARQNVFLDTLISTLSASFATLATVLAAIGLYGVLAFTVAQRTREFGLRMALGADPANVRAIVMRQVGWMTIVGAAIGLASAVALGIVTKANPDSAQLLFGLEGYDPVVLAISTTLLGMVALGAGFIPALRASRIDPMQALRYE